MNNTAKCYREKCPFMLDNKCNRPQGSCGGNRWTNKPKQTKKTTNKKGE